MARKPGPALTREQVIEAALGVVDAEGPEALGTSRVARALGIRPPSLYHHFDGNDALRLAVAVAGWERLVAALPPVEGDLAASLAAYAAAYRAFALDHPALYRVMTETPFDPGDADLLAVTAKGMQRLAGLGLLGDDALHAIRGLRAALHGYVHLEVSGQVRLPVSSDESFDWLVDRVVAAITAG